VQSLSGLLPATRFAVDAYVRFVREKSLLEAVASSLTELFAPDLHKTRIAALLENYEFATERTLAYFKKRLDQAPRDVQFGLSYVLREARARDQQGGVARGAAIQDGRAVGATRCAPLRLCGAGP